MEGRGEDWSEPPAIPQHSISTAAATVKLPDVGEVAEACQRQLSDLAQDESVRLMRQLTEVEAITAGIRRHSSGGNSPGTFGFEFMRL